MRRSKAGKDTAQVADSYKKLYDELPKAICGSSSGAAAKGDLKKFLHENLPRSERKEVDGELKKTISFHRKQQGKRGSARPKGGRKGQYLTSKERRALGLNRLPPRAKLPFEDFKGLNGLWLDYMRELIGDVQAGVVPPPPEPDTVHTVGDEQLQMRVARADYHGALVKVVDAKCDTLVGTEGFVAMETRNTLQVVTRRNAVKTIPKRGSAFAFRVDSLVFTVGGTNMCAKPSERAVKKWKTRPPFDLP